jgi:hypothetical protein
MKHADAKKKSLRLGPQQLVIELADRFQLRPQPLIIPHPLLDLLPLFGSHAELAGSTSTIAYCQNPNPVALSPTTLDPTPAMEDLAVQQGTAQDFSRIVQCLRQLLARFEDFGPLHQY